MPLKHAAEASVWRGFFEALFAIGVLLCVGCQRAAVDPVARVGGEIVVLLPREPDQLDPRFVGDAYGLKLSRLLHASLVRMNSETLEPEPDLAESIEIADPTHYRVQLRPDLRFSDGSPLDADDVVATFRALVDPKVRSRYASTYRRIRAVHPDGPRGVVFELEAPHATFVTDLEIPVLRAEDAYLPARADRSPVGAGPYRLARREPGVLELHTNPRYHAGPPLHPKLRFVVVHDDNTRALRMLAGAGDLALNAVPPLLVPLFARPGFKVASAAGIGTTYVGINLQHPVLRDVRVRQALAHALDRESLIAYKFGGRARMASSWIAPGHWAFAPDTPQYARDLARARALLEEAGVIGGGRRLALTLRTSSDRFVVSTARALAAMWAEIGVDVEVRPSETATLLADLARGRFEISYLQVPEVFEPHVLSWFFASDRIPEPGVREGGNRWRLRSGGLDALLEQGAVTLERSARAEIYGRVQHLLARELPVIPLWHEDVVAITSPQLQDYRVPRDGRFATLTLPAPPPPASTLPP